VVEYKINGNFYNRGYFRSEDNLRFNFFTMTTTTMSTSVLGYSKTSSWRSGNSTSWSEWRFSSLMVLACDSFTDAISGRTSSTRQNRASQSSTS